MGLTYEKSKKVALKTILLLGAITLVEVFIALMGKGYLIKDLEFPIVALGGAMIILSLVKAYYIVMEFMHMKYEVSGLMRSVLLPTLLLVWAIIAFLWEGDTWKERRAQYYPKAEHVMYDASMSTSSSHGSDTHGHDDHGDSHDNDGHDDDHGDDHEGHDH